VISIPLVVGLVLATIVVRPGAIEAKRLDQMISEARKTVQAGERSRRDWEHYKTTQVRLVRELMELEESAVPSVEPERDRYAYYKTLESSCGVFIRVCNQLQGEPYAIPSLFAQDKPAEGDQGEEEDGAGETDFENMGIDEEDEEEEVTSPYIGVPVDLIVEGAMEPLLRFLDMLQAGPRLHAMESFRISRTESGDLQMRIRVTALLRQ